MLTRLNEKNEMLVQKYFDLKRKIKHCYEIQKEILEELEQNINVENSSKAEDEKITEFAAIVKREDIEELIVLKLEHPKGQWVYNKERDLSKGRKVTSKEAKFLEINS